MMLGYTAFLNTSNNDSWSSNMTFRLHIDHAKLFCLCAGLWVMRKLYAPTRSGM